MPVGRLRDDPRSSLLGRLRGAAGLTQEELAERAGISVRSVSNLERGSVSHPHRSSLERLADALGLAPHDREHLLAHYRHGHQAEGRGAPFDGWIVPSELPAGSAPLVGRTAELAALDDALAHERPDGGLVTLDGLAGIGKTTLALAWARSVGDRFPDGSIYLNLRGHGPLPPMSPEDALERLLGSCAVESSRIPADLPLRSAMLRSTLAGCRMLLVLDNASDSEQVRPLLPAAPGCLVLVTSRERLDGLVVREGAQRIHLRKLDRAGSERLVRARLGDRPVPGASLQRVLGFCDGHPLALSLLGVRAAIDGIDSVAATISDPGPALGLLSDGDDDSTLDTVFSWSIAHLAPDAQALLLAIGVHPGEVVDGHTAAALAGCAPAQAARLLSSLHRANLLESRGHDTYVSHDLLRRYLSQAALSSLPAGEVTVIRSRLLAYWQATAYDAASRIEPIDHHRVPHPVPDPIVVPLAIADRAAAQAWLGRELPGLLTLARDCADGELAPRVTDLAATLWRYLMVTARTRDSVGLHRVAVRAARRSGDRVALGHASCDLGAALIMLEEYDDAVALLDEALDIARDRGDLSAQARAVANLGVCHERNGRLEEALGCHREAMRIAVAADDAAAQARSQNGIGAVLGTLDRRQESREHFEEALRLALATGDETTQGRALMNLGILARLDERSDEALELMERCLQVARSCGHLVVEAETLVSMGETHRVAGRPAEAGRLFREGFDLADRHDLAPIRTDALIGMGELAISSGDHASAAGLFGRAASGAGRTGDRQRREAAEERLALARAGSVG